MVGTSEVALFWLALQAVVEASEWTRFRGPNGSGVARTSGLPIELGPETNVVWRTALPPGHSSPVLSSGRIFLTALEEEALFGKIFMVSESGKVAVLKPDGSLDLLALNDLGERSYATPAIADGRIYIRTETALYSFGSQTMPQASGIHQLVLQRPNASPLRYSLSLPKPWNAGAPLILSLHYAGHGAPYYGKAMLESLVEPALRDLDAVVVAPDCPSSSWTTKESEDAVLALLDTVAEIYGTDRERVVVTGYSMGGMGTWQLVSRHPDRFSAAIPMAGSPRNADLDAVARTPLYAIHSRTDEVVPLTPTSDAVARLKKAGARAELVVVDVPHYESVRFEPHLKKAIEWLREIWEEKSNANRLRSKSVAPHAPRQQ